MTGKTDTSVSTMSEDWVRFHEIEYDVRDLGMMAEDWIRYLGTGYDVKVFSDSEYLRNNRRLGCDKAHVVP